MNIKHLKKLREFLKLWGDDSIQRHITNTDIPILRIRCNGYDHSDDAAILDYLQQYTIWEELESLGVVIDLGMSYSYTMFRKFEVIPEYKEALMIYYI